MVTRNILAPARNRTTVIQTTDSHFTDEDFPDHTSKETSKKILSIPKLYITF
jgi:hypothetical protein